MSETTLATEATTTSEGQADTTPTADSSSAEGTEQQQTQQDATTTEPKASADKGEAPAEPEKPEPKAPESYEFTNPEGVPGEVGAEIHDAYSQAARELDLSQEQAQTLFNSTMVGTLAMLDKQAKELATAAEKDSEFGGTDFKENVATAEKALDEFGSDELKALLRSTPTLANHPELIRFMWKVGKAVSEDSFVASSAGDAGDPSSEEAKDKRWYPNTPQ